MSKLTLIHAAPARKFELKEVKHVLASLDKLQVEVRSAQTYEQLRKIEKKAEVFKFWWSEIEGVKIRCEDVILDAHIKLGEETKKIAKAKGGRPQKTGAAGGTGFSAPTLKEQGLTKKQSSRAQRLASASKTKINEAKKELREQGKDATPHAVLKLLTQGDKKDRREQREQALSTKLRALPDKRYGVIYVDPPWRFEPYSRDTGMDRAADNHYPTATVDEIAKIKVPAAEDCALFLWATVPMLPEALKILQAWGFEYRTNWIWFKDRVGTGYWNRNRHEILLLGIRGKVPAPAPGDQYESVLMAPVGKHSSKPFAFHEMIEDMFPTLPKLEMFARERFAGWDAWGNEVDFSEAAE